LDTLKEVRDYLLAEFSVGRGSITPDENLLGRILDSMGLLKLVAFLEERYSFETTEEDIVPENFGTLEKIRDFVERKTRP
jgi:acyl carrier protein